MGEPSHTRGLASRLDALIGELTALRTEMLSAVAAPDSLQKKLLGLFTQPVIGRSGGPVEGYSEISPGIWLGFEPTAAVSLTVEPKRDYAASPDTFLNTVTVDFTGSSRFLTIETSQGGFSWSEVCDAQRFQLAFCATPSRSVLCTAAIHLLAKAGGRTEIIIDQFTLDPGKRSVDRFGEIKIPGLDEFDTTQNPKFLIFFDTGEPLTMRLDYMNIYFA